MESKKRYYFSLILEIVVVISSIIGIVLSLLKKDDQFMGGPSTLLYFTIQSNIWISFTLLLIFICKIIEKVKNRTILKRWMYIVKYIFSISISLTGIVYCFLLAPFMPSDYNPWELPSILTHAIVPLLAVVDLFVDQYKIKITNKNLFMVLLPPIYYLIFALIGYFVGFEYSTGENYPYFFLNFGCDAGLFGIIKDPIEIGCFYWMVLLLLIVLGLGLVYKLLINKRKDT